MILSLNPEIKKKSEFKNYCDKIKDIISNLGEEEYIDTFLELNREINSEFSKNLSFDDLALLTAKSVTLDLITQGWEFKNSSNSIELTYKQENILDIEQEKARIRNSHLYQRNKQLQEKSVKEFIDKCERKRIANQKWKSIFSLMKDGKILAEQLREINKVEERDVCLKLLSKVIKPYIQIAEPGKVDEFTNIQLLDIWRYFRHTWVIPYKVLPGRSIAVLIRDAATENHPIIGIAALGSSVAQFSRRDRWIGWEPSAFIEDLIESPSAKKGKYLIEMLSKLISEIYKKDLFKEGVLDKQNLQNPSDFLIKKLKKMSQIQIEKHRRSNKDIFSRLKKNHLGGDNDWEFYANTSLYKSKRYRSLAILLSVRRTFQDHDFYTGSKKELQKALKSNSFKKSVGQLVRKIKAENVGIKMMDIVVCGALPPYNHLLGGKLVCSLLLSPEITKYYNDKYSNSVSIIASCMSGRKIKRNQDLVLLNTTSLYGIGSSQYNRIKIPANEIGGNEKDKIEFMNLGFSKGYGSFQFSKETIDLIHHLVGRKREGRVVNSIFGEGANPLMRKLREGLELVGFPSAEILNHGNKRILYSVPLSRNFRNVLLGLESKPKYYIPQSKRAYRTQLLVNYWLKRWLINRIKNPQIIERVEEHTLDHPITHGARVPKIQDSLPLFNA